MSHVAPLMMWMTLRAFLVEKVTATENSLRAALRNFGLKMGAVNRRTWEARARELAIGQEVLEQIVEAMLRVRGLLLVELEAVEAHLLAQAKAASGHAPADDRARCWRCGRPEFPKRR